MVCSPVTSFPKPQAVFTELAINRTLFLLVENLAKYAWQFTHPHRPLLTRRWREEPAPAENALRGRPKGPLEINYPTVAGMSAISMDLA